MLALGLDHAGVPVARQQKRKEETNLQSFRSTYKVGPAALAQVVNRLHQSTVDNAENSKLKKVDPLKVLNTVSWLANYQNEKKMEGEFNRNEKTIRNDNWQYSSAIASLKDDVVRRNNWRHHLLVYDRQPFLTFCFNRLCGLLVLVYMQTIPILLQQPLQHQSMERTAASVSLERNRAQSGTLINSKAPVSLTSLLLRFMNQRLCGSMGLTLQEQTTLRFTETV